MANHSCSSSAANLALGMETGPADHGWATEIMATGIQVKQYIDGHAVHISWGLHQTRGEN